MDIQPTEVSSATQWVVKVTAKDTITVTCPEGFQNLVGEEIPIEALNHAISFAFCKENRDRKWNICRKFSCTIY